MRGVAQQDNTILMPMPDRIAVTDGLTNASVKAPYLNTFPYLGVPYSGFDNPS